MVQEMALCGDAFKEEGRVREASRGGAQALFLKTWHLISRGRGKVPWFGGSGPVGRLPDWKGLQSSGHMARGFLNSTFLGQKRRHGGGARQAAGVRVETPSAGALPGVGGVGQREKQKGLMGGSDLTWVAGGGEVPGPCGWWGQESLAHQGLNHRLRWGQN